MNKIAAVIFAAKEHIRSGKEYYPYRQNSDFYYLTGNPGEAFRINLPENCISIDTKY